MPQTNTRLLTVAEAAEQLRVGPITIERMARDGSLEEAFVGSFHGRGSPRNRGRRIVAESVEALVARRRAAGATGHAELTDGDRQAARDVANAAAGRSHCTCGEGLHWTSHIHWGALGTTIDLATDADRGDFLLFVLVAHQPHCASELAAPRMTAYKPEQPRPGFDRRQIVLIELPQIEAAS